MHFTSIVLIAIVQLYSSFSYAFCTYTSRWSSSHTLYSSHTLHTEELRPSPPTADIVLSAGNCAFAHHCGFLEGVEQALSVDRVGAVLGTSSGALVGALWAAGYSAKDIARIIEQESKEGGWLAVVKKPRRNPWRGLFSLLDLVVLLQEYLPPTFEELLFPFAVQVQDSDGKPSLLRSGPLPEAVAASLAAAFIFKPVVIQGKTFRSTAARDWTGLSACTRWRPGRRVLVHCVEDGRGLKGDISGLGDWVQDPRIVVIRSPRSRSSFLRGLVEYEQEHMVALKRMLQVVAPEVIHQLPSLYPDEAYAEYLFASLDA